MFVFTVRRYASAVCAVTVRLSICPPSQVSLLSKQLNTESRKQHLQ